eukprot:42691_1
MTENNTKISDITVKTENVHVTETDEYKEIRTFATAKGMVLQVATQFPKLTNNCRAFDASLRSEKEWLIEFLYLSIKNVLTRPLIQTSKYEDRVAKITKKQMSTGCNGKKSIDAMFVIYSLERIKKRRLYKIMQYYKKTPTIRQLSQLFLYTYNRDYGNKMRKSQNQSYVEASNAVEKIYRLFHCKNGAKHPHMLFHGTSNASLDQFSKEDLFFPTFCSFTSAFAIAKNFAVKQNGSILIIDKVDEKLRSGELKAADVSWISPWPEYEWIVLPTRFRNWKELSKQDIIDYGWSIPDGIKVYITDDYKSNINSLSGFSDVNVFANNDDLQAEKDIMDRAIKNWLNTFGFLEMHNIKYFKSFVNNGYDTFEMIKEIHCID